MSHPNHKAEVVSIQPLDGQSHLSEAQRQMFADYMKRQQDAICQYIQDLAGLLGVTEKCAADVWYLRGRSRWTQELEDLLIKEHAEGRGDQINMNEFGHS